MAGAAKSWAALFSMVKAAFNASSARRLRSSLSSGSDTAGYPPQKCQSHLPLVFLQLEQRANDIRLIRLFRCSSDDLTDDCESAVCTGVLVADRLQVNQAAHLADVKICFLLRGDINTKYLSTIQLSCLSIVPPCLVAKIKCELHVKSSGNLIRQGIGDVDDRIDTNRQFGDITQRAMQMLEMANIIA